MSKVKEKIFSHLFNNRQLMWTLAVNEVKIRYIGTFAGFLWSIVHPITIALIYWFIFSGLFKTGRTGGDIPYICYFLSGFIPWIMLTEALMSSTNAIVANPHYVKKIIFPTELLPVINLLASLVTQITMFIILIVTMLFFKVPLSINIPELLIYFILLCSFILGLSWISSALNVFYRDVAQILSVILNIWFWGTPIVWILDVIPTKFHIIIQLNPMFFIVNGYRSALFKTGFNLTDHPYFFIYNLFIILGLLYLGKFVFYKLKPDFADIL